MSMPLQLWLRAESKPMEQRTALTPACARALVEAGWSVTVEDCPRRAIPLGAYQEAGCQVAAAHSWSTAAPADAFVFGLKELATDVTPLAHRHIHFAHVYKHQRGWARTLKRFHDGGGTLFDLEYLVDEDGRRVAAFGHWAGFAGAAVALMGWASQQPGATQPLGPIQSQPNAKALLAEVSQRLAVADRKPRVFVIGALGRSGRGATELCETLGTEVIAWDIDETKQGGPFPEILDADVFINCVFVQSSIPPFLTEELLKSPQRRLSLICDVSCDPYGDYNPLPIYDRCTTFDAPKQQLISGDRPLDLIAIDHLPSLLPVESSEDFCGQLMPYLLQLEHLESGVWARARQLFDAKVEEALRHLSPQTLA